MLEVPRPCRVEDIGTLASEAPDEVRAMLLSLFCCSGLVLKDCVDVVMAAGPLDGIDREALADELKE